MLLISNLINLEYFTENNSINIRLNSYSDSYSLLIKVKQSNDTDEYYVGNVWRFVVGTMCINIFEFLRECEWDINFYSTL